MSIDKLKNKFMVGAFIKDVKHFFEKINEIIDWINNVGSTAVPNYKVYDAMLKQSGTNAPVEVNIDGTVTNTPFKDDINGVWTYSDVGLYNYVKLGAFPDANKVQYFLSNNDINQGSDLGIVLYRLDENTLQLRVGVISGYTSPAAIAEANSRLFAQPIKIIVYN